MTGIFDSHTHAWNRWPYEDPADPDAPRGEKLIAEMDANGVDRALIVCADIDPTVDNNTYVAEVVHRFRDRLDYSIDADCSWSANYHKPRAPERLLALAEQFPDAAAITHYVDSPDGWFSTGEGRRWLDLVTSRYGILSLAASPEWGPAVAEVASAYPRLDILWHHLGTAPPGDQDAVNAVASVAAEPNVALKLSGFHYYAAQGASWDGVLALLDTLYDAYGPRRMCFGSDFPASLRYTDYATSLAQTREWLARHDGADQDAMLGGALTAILQRHKGGATA